jgi:hypothetical protein
MMLSSEKVADYNEFAGEQNSTNQIHRSRQSSIGGCVTVAKIMIVREA